MKRAKRHPFAKILRQRLELHLDNRSSDNTVPAENQFRRWIWQAVKQQYRRAEISVVLLDEDEARACNRDYRGKDYATNVLSFALDEDQTLIAPALSDGLHGDLVICPQVVLREAATQGKTPEQHYAHLTIHGVLHLMGYDHAADSEAEEMEALETALLNQLAYPDPYK
ncbi:Probable rRNA maturation factor [Kingella potus]|uniref:Endoribonuclease YbeY n=1 Tax=Kingella potus TaxID=265175 RepID=A0A377R050_9NEIS|nr:rRNA maturation RNase YbeY [Kingella potus]UOP00984.1 rRNA maturation RNase YbeY [Kingella potus]STR00647.1 Probable rRNA maturation factor [Kingella potus]